MALLVPQALAERFEENSPDCTVTRLLGHQTGNSAVLRCLTGDDGTRRLAALETNALYSEVDYYSERVATTGSVLDAELVRLFVTEKERRKPPKWSPSAAIYSAFLLSGQVKRAQAEREAKRLQVPNVDFSNVGQSEPGPGKAASWTFGRDGELVQGVTDLAHGAHIVVYAEPGCRACETATALLAADPQLAEIFEKHAIWVSLPTEDFGAEYFKSWDRRYPRFQIRAIFDRSNWPRQRLPTTPDFFFVKNGKVLAEVLGWSDGSKERIRSIISRMGF